jgi:hypothetical protein
MLASPAWLKHALSKERAFPSRAEIPAEMLRAIDPGKRRAPAGVGSGLISNLLSSTLLRMDGRGAGDLKLIGRRPPKKLEKLDQSSLIKLVIPKSQTAANRELGWFLAATRTRSGSGQPSLASERTAL